MNDPLYTSAVFYHDVLESGRFALIVRKKGEERKLVLHFPTEAYCHLAGLHKLTDMPAVRRSPANVYREILDGKLTWKNISRSIFAEDIRGRLEALPSVIDLMSSGSLYFQSMHGVFKGIKADFVITSRRMEMEDYMFLFFRGTVDAVPCSFFVRNEQREYTREGIRWTILSFEKETKTQ